MTYIVTIAEAAEEDIRNAFIWYDEQKPGLGDTFEKQVLKAIESIKSNPMKNQIRYGDIRVYFLISFPFGIHFNVLDKNILIVGIFHTSLHPERWKDR
jgi:toxin ParE1/3/4